MDNSTNEKQNETAVANLFLSAKWAKKDFWWIKKRLATLQSQLEYLTKNNNKTRQLFWFTENYLLYVKFWFCFVCLLVSAWKATWRLKAWGHLMNFLEILAMDDPVIKMPLNAHSRHLGRPGTMSWAKVLGVGVGR